MKQFRVGILAAFAMLLLAACGGSSFKKTKSGLMYKIITDGKNPVVKNGQVIKFEYVQKIRDSILSGSADNGPAYVTIDSSITPDYNPVEVFGLVSKGDSVVVIMEVDTLRKKAGGQLPPFLKPKDKIILTMKVLNVFTTVEESEKDKQVVIEQMMKKQAAEAEVQKGKDLKVLEDYLKSKNITAQKAPKGTLVEIKEAGSGLACDSGMYVTVNYTGQTLAGKVFDSSIEPSFGHQPYTLQIGAHGAIEGWDDGLRLLRKGSKANLYIPSALGYGKRGNGADIKPDENLQFYVEILDVKDKMPPPPPPMAPGGGQQGNQ